MTTTLTRNELALRIADRSLLRGDFTLRSGRRSSYYLDKYLFSTDPEILAALGSAFRENIATIPGGVARLAGAELGGIPLVTTAAMATGLPCVFIRNQKKTYGTAKQMEGVVREGERIAILEDIATTGGQVLEAANLLAERGAQVVRIIATIDREEGARANIEAAGYQFDALFTVRDLGVEPEPIE